MADIVTVISQSQIVCTVQDGTSDHRGLSGRSATDQHPTSAITGLDTALAGKVDKVAGKGLSEADFTAAEKSKLAGVADGANNYVHPTNHPPAIITQDANNRFVTDAEKAAWNGNFDAERIASGTIDLARLPEAAIERLVQVANQTARYALTTATVQLGDTVKQIDTGLMYVVVDVANLGNAAGYVEYTAGSAAAVPWSGVSNKPTTLGGYGITDAAPKSHSDSTGNPHGVTKSQVGLGSCDNTSDANKPVSTAQQTALNLKSNNGHSHVTGPVAVDPTFTRLSDAYDDTLKRWEYGQRRWDSRGTMVEEGTTNLLTASDSLSFAAPVNVTVVSGTKYTVSCATGEITLSGAGSGVVTSSTPVTITASTTTLTLTPTGTATYSQVE